MATDPKFKPQREIARIKAQLRKIDREKEKSFPDLGRATYQAFLEGRLTDSALMETCERLKGLDAQMEQLKADIQRLQAQPPPMATTGFVPSAGVCANCGAPLNPGMKFCGNCGAAVQPLDASAPAAACVSCGSPLPPGTVFCGECGAPAQTAQAAAPAPPAPVASPPPPPVAPPAAPKAPEAPGPGETPASETSRKCPSCGATIEEKDATFCGECGNKL